MSVKGCCIYSDEKTQLIYGILNFKITVLPKHISEYHPTQHLNYEQPKDHTKAIPFHVKIINNETTN